MKISKRLVDFARKHALGVQGVILHLLLCTRSNIKAGVYIIFCVDRTLVRFIPFTMFLNLALITVL